MQFAPPRKKVDNFIFQKKMLQEPTTAASVVKKEAKKWNLKKREKATRTSKIYFAGAAFENSPDPHQLPIPYALLNSKKNNQK